MLKKHLKKKSGAIFAQCCKELSILVYRFVSLFRYLTFIVLSTSERSLELSKVLIELII